MRLHVLFFYFALLMPALPVLAADGDLDTTYNTPTGFNSVTFGASDNVYGGLLQPDGKLIVIGGGRPVSNQEMSVVRYNADGTLDTGFATSGKLSIDITVATTTDRGTCGGLQSDGKIIIGGYTRFASGNDNFAVIRLNTNGTLDTTFGTSGIAQVDFNAGSDRANALVILPDNSIVLTGFASDFSGSPDIDLGIAKLTPNGALDLTFDTDGKRTVDIADQQDTGLGIAVQSDGKIVFCGQCFGTGVTYSLVGRLTPAGSLDVSFGGGDGLFTSTILPLYALRSVIIDPDGKIVVAGDGQPSGSLDALVMRLTTAGDFDTTFNTTGYLNVNFGSGSDFLSSVVRQSDGKYIAGGTWSNTGTGFFETVVMKVTPAGALDSTFGTGGIKKIALGAGNNRVASVHLASTGKVLVSLEGGTSGAENFIAARFENTVAASSSAPTVTTAAQSAVTATSATLGGNVTADGGASVTERGIVWGTSTGPTTANNKVQNGSGTGAFSGTVTGLPAGTTVFVRAYAINSVNTSYGSEISFPTLSNNADLSALSTTAGSITFSAATTAYAANVPNVTTSVTVTATRAEANATLAVQVNGGGFTALTSGAASGALALNVGANPIDVRVTAQDGTTIKTYTITVTRAAVPPNLTINDVTQSEGNSGTTTFSFTVSLSAPAPAGGVTFDIATANGTATQPGDYTQTSQTSQTIAAGNSTFTFNVPVLGDTAVETNETFFVNVTNITGATALDAQGLGTITNDDVATPPTITSVSPASGPIAGGTTVVITGTGFTGATAVNFGTTPATGFTVNSPTQITATLPAGTGGIFDVSVVTGTGTGTGSGLFYYFTTTGGTPAVAASKVDIFTPNGAGKVLPGAPIQYRTLIANTGAGDATTVDFADAIPANTTLVPGSVNVSPLAEDNSYATIVNTQLAAGAPTVLSGPLVTSATKVTDNDREFLADTFTISAFDATSANGGSVVMVTSGPNMGSFTYVPAAGFVGVDSFTYTLRDDGTDSTASNADDLTGIGIVTITVNEADNVASGTQKVWYIDSGYAGANGVADGTSARPFTSMTSVSGATGPDAVGDTLYVATGTSNYGFFAFLLDQTLWGANNALIFNGVTLATASAKPVFENAGGAAITLSGAGGTNTIRGISVANSAIASNNGSGAFGTLVISNTTMTGTSSKLDLVNGTVNGTIDSLTATSGVNGVSLTNVNGTLTITAGAISGTSGDDFSVSGGTAVISYGGTITNSAGRSVNVANKTGGSVTFSGSITDTVGSTGISLTSNTGSTISFTGGLTVSTSTNAAFTATGGGTVTVTGATNTLTTTTGTALNVANTTIGASGLTFQSISANGATSGIVLNNTGSSGGLTVTGTGSAGTGGTIQTCSSHGISLTSTSGVRLSWMNVTNNLGNGISGSTINGFLIDRFTISGNGNDAATDESGINLAEVTGGAFAGANPTGITNSTITNNNEFEVQITNNTGTLTDFRLTNNNISSNGQPINGNVTSPHGNLVNFIALGTASMTLTSSGGTYTGNWNSASPPTTITATALHVDHSGTSGTMTADISGASFTNNNVAVTVANANGGNLVFDIHDNPVVTGNRSHGLNLFVAASSTGSVLGKFRNNVVGTLGTAGSGSELGFGIRVQNEAIHMALPVTLLLTGNTVQQTAGFNLVNINTGIAAQPSTKPLNVTIIGNTLRNSAARAITIQQNNNTNPTSAGTIAANISGNTFSGITGQAGDATEIRLRKLDVNGGVFNVTQADVNSLATINGLTPPDISVSGTVTFNQPPPPQPLLFAASLPDTTENTATPKNLPAKPRATTAARPAQPDLGAPAAAKAVLAEKALTDENLQKLIAEAKTRWIASGLTLDQKAAIEALRFEISDLSELHLGQAAGDLIQISRTAAGNAWFIDETPDDDAEFERRTGFQPVSSDHGLKVRSTVEGVDLLTTLMHEMGHRLGLPDTYDLRDRSSIMYGYLTRGERRLPAPNQARAAVLSSDDTQRFLGATINIGTLPAGKSVTIVGTVLVNDPANTQLISSRGNITGGNFAALVTDDPAAGGTTDFTTTPVERPDATVVSLLRTDSNPNNTSDVGWQVVFSAPVSGLNVSHFALVNGGLTAPSITSVGTAIQASEPDTTWNITVSTGSGNGTLGLNMTNDAGALSHDITNLPSTGQVYTIDKIAPVFTLMARQSPSVQNTNADTLTFQAAFSETVTGVNAADFTVSGTTATISSVTGTGPYDITLSGGDLANLNGTVSLALAAGQNIADTAGNPLPATAPITNQTYIVDNTAPTVALSSTTLDPAPNAVIPVTVQFSETVTGFDLTDITVAGGSKGNFVAVDGDTYTFDLTPTGPGVTVTADIAANAAQDAATNGNTAATQFSRTIPPPPTVTLNTADLLTTATSLTISGTGFSTTPANNTVAFTPAGTTGTVTASTATSLTVSVSGLVEGSLSAVVTSLGSSSGAPVQVATVVKPLISGTLSVGVGQAYLSLTNASGVFDTINKSTVTGNIIIEITSDLTGETGTVSLNQFAAGFSVLIRPSGAPRSVTGSSTASLIRLNEADNVTIDGSTTGATAAAIIGGDPALRQLTITNTNAGTGSYVLAASGAANGAQNNTFKNLNIVGSGTNLVGIAIGGATPGNAGFDNDNNRIENCSIQKTTHGIYSAGQSAGNPNTGTIITRNDLSATGVNRVTRMGIVVFNDDGIAITENSIGSLETTNNVDVIGIGLGTQGVDNTTITSGGVSNGLVSRNKINGVFAASTTGFSAAGIAVAGGTAGANVIVNNMISGVIAPATSPDIVAGIFVAGAAGSSTLVHFNSIALTGNRGAVTSQLPSYGIAITGTNPSVNVRNNIFSNILEPGSGGANAKSYAIGMASTTFTNLTSNHNLFYSAGTAAGHFRTGSLATVAGTDHATLAAWQTATSQDANSFFGDPLFTSATDLHITNTASPAWQSGAPISGITTDFDGDIRGTTPNIGADDVAKSVSIGNLAAISEGNSGTTNFVFTITRTGDTTGDVNMTYTVSGAAVDGTDFVGGTLPTGTATITSGNATTTVTIPVSGDTTVEPNEAFNVTLSAPDNGYVVLGAPATSTINNDDAATVSIAKITDGAEANTPTNGKFRVTQTAASSVDTTVAYTVTGTASSGTDFTALSGSVTILAGQTTADIDVTVLNDGTVLEPTETVILTVNNVTSTNNVTQGSPATATMNLTDDDTATVTIAKITDGAETPTSAVFRVTQTAQATVDTVITYSTGGTATSGSDYTAPTGSVTILAGNTTADITVTITNDAIVEATETLSLTLTGFTARDADVSLGATLTATADITDNDTATVTIAKITDAAEPSTNGLFRVTQTAVSSTNTVVTYGVTGTAASGTDFTALSGSVTILAGNTTADISVAVIDENLVEASETVIATLNGFSARDADISLGATVAATVNITDNDTATVTLAKITDGVEAAVPTNAVFRVTQTNPASVDTVVTYSVGGTATFTFDYTGLTGFVTILAGNTTADITVAVSNENMVEPTETVTLTLNGFTARDPEVTLGATLNASADITDSDTSEITLATVNADRNEGTGGASTAFTFSATLSNPVQGGFTTAYTTNDGTALAGSDYTDNDSTLNFTGTAGEVQTITVSVTHDGTNEIDEDFTVALGAVSGLAGGINSSRVTTAGSPQTGTIRNDDALTVSIAATDADADENTAGTGTWRVSRNGVLGSTTVQLQIDASSSAVAADWTQSGATFASRAAGSTGTIVIPAGDTFVDITLTPSADLHAEAAETLRLNVTADAGYTVGSPDNATVTIGQNDFLVINTNDSGEGTLRQAILNANDIPGDDTITFGGSVFTDGTVPDVITLTSGSLTLASNIIVQGLGSGLLTITASTPNRVALLNTGANVGLFGLTISGTGIQNSANLTIGHTTFANNNSNGAGAAMFHQEGNLTMYSSTFSGNTTTSTFNGGALQLNSAGMTSVVNCTFSGNSGNNGGAARVTNGTAIFTHCTMTANTGRSSAPGISRSAGSVSVSNCIIAGNVNNTTVADIGGTFTSGGGNIIGNVGTATGFTATNDLTGTGASPVNPLLGPLQDNGGPTLTHMLLNGSPAINNGLAANLPADTFDLDGDLNVAEALPVDQRGGVNLRTRGTAPDAGAVEAFAFEPTITASTTDEDTQSTSGLVVSANTADGGLTTHFKITGILNGTLFQNDGTTAIAEGSYITEAEGAAGLKFTPSLNLNTPNTPAGFGFSAQAAISTSAGDERGVAVPVVITVNSINDLPTVVAPGLPDIRLTIGDVVVIPLGANFADVDLQTLTFTVSGNTVPAKASATITGSTNVTVTGLTYGVTDLTIQADDGAMGLVTDTFQVAVGTVEPTALSFPLTTTPPGTGGNPYRVNPQTAAFDFDVQITNTTAFAINGIRLKVILSMYDGLPLVQRPRLLNFSSPVGVTPAYVDYPYPVAIGETVTMRLTFFVPSRVLPVNFNPGLIAERYPFASAVAGPLPVGPVFTQATIQANQAGRILLTWPSTPGRWYRIYYSANLTSWTPSATPIQASANQVQWIDTGAPFTQTPPAGARYYMVTEIPAPAP